MFNVIFVVSLFLVKASPISFSVDESLEIFDPNLIVFVRSFQSLKILATTEHDLYEVLKNYSETVDETSPDVTRYLNDYAESAGRLSITHSNFSSIIASHPLLTARMLNRYAVDLRNILELSQYYLYEINGILQKTFEDLDNAICWPNVGDVEEAWRAILRIVFVYDMKVDEVARGNFLGVNTGFGFRAKDCAAMSEFAIKEKHYYQAVEWAEVAKILVEREKDESIELEIVQEMLDLAALTHDIEIDNEATYSNKFFMYRLNESMRYNPPLLRQNRRNYSYNLWKGKREINFNENNFWGLCSGEDLRTEDEKSKLYCYLESKANPAWYINPLKIEQLSKSPDVLQIYEVLPDSLTEKLINIAQPGLKKSYVNAPEGNRLTRTRTSASTWIDEFKFDLGTIPRRIELITNLVVVPKDSSESLQLASYSFGGHYEVHLDTSKRARASEIGDKMGDRIATFMIYLTDTDLGGYTAFAQGGIAALPVKGSAVFWYNLKRNGEIDEDTHHGACPVILGSKWVANKWIRSFRQTFRRTCSLNPDE